MVILQKRGTLHTGPSQNDRHVSLLSVFSLSMGRDQCGDVSGNNGDGLFQIYLISLQTNNS